jgi:hypothetical protein
MDFANERYVRLYTRDTMGWKKLRWEGRLVWMELYRKADRSGIVSLGGDEPWEAAVILCDIPEEVAKVGMERCLDREWIVRDGDRLVFPEYIEANETPQSDAQRQRESRAKRAAVTKRDGQSQNVTDCHAESHGVTPSHTASLLTVPSRAVLNRAVPPQDARAREEQGAGQPEADGGSAIAGRVWLRDVLGRDDYDHRGKWEHALEQIARKPESEKAAAAASIKRELEKPGIRAVMHPQHVLDYWARYSSGTAPGKQQLAKADTSEATKWRSRVQQSTKKLEELKERRSQLQPGPNYASDLYDLDKAIREETDALERRKRELHALTG